MAGNNSIVLGGGCFWCLDALFSMVNGVTKVVSGYAGGHTQTPSYEAVCSGATGHAEVVKIDFDPTVISLETILEIFWATHDPTTPDQQGADIGSQYRSIILYSDSKQKEIILAARIKAQKLWDAPIVTNIEPLKEFYAAEPYHQNYFATNPDKAYCQIVINPKLSHFKQNFSQYLKPNI